MSAGLTFRDGSKAFDRTPPMLQGGDTVEPIL
jgi:hypothetical protein